jgi:3-oxoacyl-[acyl-carrier-protein] synthase-3
VPFLKAFSAYLPDRIVTNEEIGARAGCTSDWIVGISGIEERRFAGADETVATLGVRAGDDCLKRAGIAASEIAMIIVASGSWDRQFPGPAASIAHLLGLKGTPALDLCMASAGSLFGLSLASQLASALGPILVVGAEKMSDVVEREPLERGVAVLFGDGAGACLVHPTEGFATIVDSVTYSDGALAEDLKLAFGKPLEMNGRSVILHASRKMPGAIETVMVRNGRKPSDAARFLVHQANQNLIVRVAQVLDVPEERFHSTIRRYGNTSSASMMIAAEESLRERPPVSGELLCFAAFGAGFHWGALLASVA